MFASFVESNGVVIGWNDNSGFSDVFTELPKEMQFPAGGARSIDKAGLIQATGKPQDYWQAYVGETFAP